MKKYFVLKLTNKLFSLQGRNAATYFFARISGLLVQILTVPLLAKSLGVKGVGTIAYAQAIVVFLGGFVDFGFNVTATRLIALAKNNNRALRELFWTIQASRAILLVVALIILFIVAEFFTSSDSEKYVVMLGSLAIIGMYLTPQWFFQGLEKIPSYVIATIIPRGVALVMIYTQVKDHNDLIVAAALMFLGEASIGGGLSLLVTLKYLPGTPIFSMSVFKSQIGLALDGWLANIGFSVVAILNSIFVKNLLGLHAFGLYSSVEKIVRTSHSLVWPLAQSYYPLMCSHVKLKSKSYAFREALKYSIALGGGGAAGVFILIKYSTNILNALYSHEFLEGEGLMSMFAPFLFFASLNNAICYFFLYPIGCFDGVRKVSMITLCSAPVLLLVFLRFFGLNGACAGIAVNEMFVVIMLVFLIKKNYVISLGSVFNKKDVA